MQGPHQNIHFLLRIVERERSADGLLDAEVAQRRLRAVMSRARGDAVLIQMPGNFSDLNRTLSLSLGKIDQDPDAILGSLRQNR